LEGAALDVSGRRDERTSPAMGGRFPNFETVPCVGTPTRTRSNVDFSPGFDSVIRTVSPTEGDSAPFRVKSTSDNARCREASGNDITRFIDAAATRFLAFTTVCPGRTPAIAPGLPGSTRHTTARSPAILTETPVVPSPP